MREEPQLLGLPKASMSWGQFFQVSWWRNTVSSGSWQVHWSACFRDSTWQWDCQDCARYWLWGIQNWFKCLYSTIIAYVWISFKYLSLSCLSILFPLFLQWCLPWVASLSASLWSRNVIRMSFAPRDSHEAQVQFALERGVPAVIGVLGTRKMPYASRPLIWLTVLVA